MDEKALRRSSEKARLLGSLAAAVMAASTVDAQVIYHDVVPDRVITNQPQVRIDASDLPRGRIMSGRRESDTAATPTA